jgi:hypothetical protein
LLYAQTLAELELSCGWRARATKLAPSSGRPCRLLLGRSVRWGSRAELFEQLRRDPRHVSVQCCQRATAQPQVGQPDDNVVPYAQSRTGTGRSSRRPGHGLRVRWEGE